MTIEHTLENIENPPLDLIPESELLNVTTTYFPGGILFEKNKEGFEKARRFLEALIEKKLVGNESDTYKKLTEEARKLFEKLFFNGGGEFRVYEGSYVFPHNHYSVVVDLGTHVEYHSVGYLSDTNLHPYDGLEELGLEMAVRGVEVVAEYSLEGLFYKVPFDVNKVGEFLKWVDPERVKERLSKERHFREDFLVSETNNSYSFHIYGPEKPSLTNGRDLFSNGFFYGTAIRREIFVPSEERLLREGKEEDEAKKWIEYTQGEVERYTNTDGNALVTIRDSEGTSYFWPEETVKVTLRIERERVEDYALAEDYIKRIAPEILEGFFR